ncbi:MAG TPA: prolyl oligopeptidase family serine peptidase [Acidobacteriota bacterium]|nr:prolyl oligopeptidase family serine peptidase [Acidobacteriota bacterium]
MTPVRTICFTLLACLAISTAPRAQVQRTEVGNLAIESIPEIPDRIVDRMRQYSNTRSAYLNGWDPSGSGIVITTRFAETAQLHFVREPLGAREQLTFFDEPVGSARVSPDTARPGILFSKDIGGDELYQIFYLDLDPSHITMVTDGKSRNGEMKWSPSGGMFAYQSTRRNGKDWDILVADINTPTEARTVVQGQGYWEPLAWSPDETRLLVENYVSINEAYYYVADVSSGEMQRVNPSDEKMAMGGGVFSGDGSTLYIITDYGSEFRHLRSLDLAGRELKTLTAQIPWDVNGLAISPSGETVAFTVNENGVSRLYLLDTRTGAYRPVPGLPAGQVSDLRFRPDGSELGFTLETPVSPGDVYSLVLADSSLVRWTLSEVGGLSRERFVSPELVAYPTFDSVDGQPRMIPAYYYKPERAAEPYSVVIQIHGGPEGQFRPYFSPRLQYWVRELGVAVLIPNVRGSSGYGRTYGLMDNGFGREESVRDIGSLLDWIDTRPELDPTRVAVYGGSYGGYMVLSSMTHYNDRLRAAVDVVGISNFVTFLENTKAYRRDLRRAEYGDERDPEMREFLNRISPTTNAHMITRPVFIAQGLNDPRVPASEAEQILQAVRKNGVEAWYLLAKDEGHGYRKKKNQDFFDQSVVLFFEQYLLK